MHAFKFRAETIIDITNLLNIRAFLVNMRKITIEADEFNMPDVDVTMFTYGHCSLENLRNTIVESGVDDLHVIIETLNYADDYTGERYYTEY